MTKKAKTTKKKASTPSEVEDAVAATSEKEENPLSGISVQQVELLMQDLYELRQEKDDKKAEFDRVSEKVKNVESRLMAFLKEFKKTSYDSTYGKVTLSTKWSFKTPKTPEDRDALRRFLEEKGEFDGLWSVNSRTLNSYCNDAFESAKESGDIDFGIPGIEEPTAYEQLSYRRGRI
jgi:hypothetical protein